MRPPTTRAAGESLSKPANRAHIAGGAVLAPILPGHPNPQESLCQTRLPVRY